MIRYFRYLGAVIVLWCCGVTSSAQNISNRGKEFWVGYGHHQFMETGTNTQQMTIYLSTEDQPATVTITIDSTGLPAAPNTWWRRTYTIPPYTVIDIENPATPATSFTATAGAFGAIPKTGSQDARLYTDAPPAGTGGAGVFRKKGIHIESNIPIVAYAHIYGSTSTGATMLLPVEAWGYSYVSLNSEQSYASNCYNWMYVVATKDNTVVEITPSVKTRAQDKTGMAPGVTKTVTLMKGQIYQVIGANALSDANGNGGTSSNGFNLSGTKVRSLAGASGECYPIAVFAGSSRTSNPHPNCSSGGGDNDNQQLFPQHAWGKRYLTTPFSGSSTPSSFANCTYKVAVMDPATVVKRNGTPITGLQNGNYYVFYSNTPDLIEADKPIMVSQFMTGGGCLGAGGLGDPEMVVVAPIEQAIKSVGFYRNTKESIGVNYVSLIVPNTGTGLSSLRIDNSSAFDLVIPHPANGQPGLFGRTYSIVVKRWSPSSQAQALIKGDSAFNAITYGLGSVESYAYSAGAYVNNLNYLNGLHNIPDTTNGGNNFNEFTGVNTPIKMGILMRYMPTKLTFKFSAWATTPAPGVITPLNNGIAPEVTAGVDFVMNPPSDYFVDSPVINGIKYYWYQLPDSFRFNIAGQHNLPVVAESPGIDNCGSKENLLLTFDVKPQPTASGSATHTTKCTKDTITLNGPATAVSASTTYNLNQWAWTISQGATIVNTFNSRNVNTLLPPGTYNVRLNAVTVHGLVVSPINFAITVYDVPTVTFNANPDTLCLGQNVVFSQSSSYGGTAPINYYSWNLDDGSPGTSATWTNKNKVYPAFGTYNTWLVVGTSPTCLSDTARKVVVVNGEASTTITVDPPNCLPPSGVANFTAGLTAQGGTPITSYSWNFDDPSTGVNNTSILREPSHAFSGPGVYTVVLSITTATGCTGKDTIIINANIAPALAWSASANFDTVCLTAAPYSLAYGTVTNGITGKPKYTGPGIDSAGMFNPLTAGAGTHTIVYTFTSDSGCVASIDTTITVSPRPAKPTVTTPVNYCQGATATPLSATPLAGHTLTWYTDPALTGGSPTAPTPSTATAGTTKYYVTQTKDACESEADTITVNIIASITNNTITPATQNICSGSVPVITASTVTGGTGSYTYQWQSSPDGSTWTDIAGATNADYTLPALTVTTHYRRVVTSDLCQNTSASVVVNVTPAIGNNTIGLSHNVCEGLQSDPLIGSTPTGGNGSFGYQWLSSPSPSGPWSAIGGATTRDYPSTLLSATTYYRRIVTSGVCADTSALPAVAITIIPNANGAISTTTPAICEYQSADITFAASAGTAPYNITYTITNPSGGTTPVTQTGVANNATFTVIPVGSAPGNYTITFNSITNSNGCVKSTGLNSVTITVNPRPVVTINPVAAVCEGTTITLTANGATTYSWTGPNLATNTGSPVTATPPAGNAHYEVVGVSNSCSSFVAFVDVTIHPRPAKPTVTSPVTYCQNGTATPLVANGAAGNTITWYTNPGLTVGSTTTPTPSTATAGTTTYYVTQTNSGNCESEAETITVTITPSIATNDLNPASQNICAGSTPVITASAVTGGTGTYTYQWQSSPDGSSWTDIAGETNPTYNPGAITTTTHYRRVVNSGLCTNTSSAVVVNVTPALSNNTIGTSHDVCEGIQPNQLTGTTPTGGDGTYSYQWISSPNTTGPWSNVATAGTGINYQHAGPLTATTSYRRIVTSGVCTDTSSAAAPVTVTVIPNANGTIETVPASGAICQYEEGKIKFNVTAGTAPVSITYTITDPSSTSTPVTQTGVANGAEFIVVPMASAAGTYTITLNSITNSNGCVKTGGFNSVTFTVTATPVVSIAPASAVCVGGSVTLTASGASTYTWSGPGANLSSTTGASVTATPATAGTYPVSVQGSTNGCLSNTANIDVVINPRPGAPTVTSPIDYCQLGTAAPLTGSGAAGNTITWYDNAALTNGVTTAPTPSTNNAGSFNYYVTQTNSFGCESVPATITINVAPGLSGNQIGSEQTICQGNTPAPLTNVGTITGGNGTYSYQWQVSTDGINFTDIPAPAGTSPGYSPGVLNDTTWYRRNVTSTLCGSVSNIVRINVFEGLGNYQINGTYPQQICENTAPTLIDGQAPTGSGTFTFTWEQSTDGGNTWTAIASSNTEDYQPPVLNTTTRYRRKVTNGPCTATSNVVEIVAMPVANGNLTAPAEICVYDAASVTFNATVGTGTFTIEYTITSPGGTVTPSGPVSVTNGSTLNVIPTGSAPGLYTIMLSSITGSNGCARTAGLNSVNITVKPRPTVTIDPVTAICEGESKTITANGASTYVWNPGPLTGNSISVTPAVTTTYQVVGTSLGCESNPVTVVITVNPKPNSSFTIADNSICLYETASFTNTSTIDSGSITELYWNFDNSNLDTIPYTTSPITQTFTTHRVYNVKLRSISDKGCLSDEFTLPLSVNSVPVASFDPPAFVCMPNGVATFQNTTTNANGSPVNYTWTFGDIASGAANTSTDVNGSHVYPDSASYNIKLLAVSAQGCRDSVTIPFNTFFNKPVAKFGVTPDTLCQGIQNAFFDSSFAPGSTIDTRLWTFGDGTTDSAASPTKTYLHPGNYQVNLKVFNTQGCSADVNKNIVVYLQPVVDAGPSFIVPVGTTVTFNAQTNSGALNLAWTSPTGGTLNNNSILKPSYIADQDGIFVLTATGEGNCSATDTLSVKVLRPINIPNAFSPNGDGINDTWGIANLADYPTAVVEVYNRYGQSVYKQYGYGKAWDGKLNGKDLPVGTYYYIIDPKSGFPRVTGYVVIVR